jgi:ribosome biogenesis protein BMS1
VKHYSKRNVSTVAGPITVISGKQRRLTFFECPNDLNAMIDIAKVADLVLLLADASYGFEMETFEFLNILQAHGFPRVMGVLTHLDLISSSKAQKHAKKRLRHRFWKEIYDGAKLFYLSGLLHGKYPKMEVSNLARFISVLKFVPLSWRTTHGYFLAARIEDVTPQERLLETKENETNSEEIKRTGKYANRDLCLYGFLHGANLKEGQMVHLAGCGDYAAASVRVLSDPCPIEKTEKQKRSLTEKERKLYAPFSDVGNVLYDADAVYVTMPNALSMVPGDGLGEKML